MTNWCLGTDEAYHLCRYDAELGVGRIFDNALLFPLGANYDTDNSAGQFEAGNTPQAEPFAPGDVGPAAESSVSDQRIS